VTLTTVSRTTVNTMRSKWHEIEAAGEERMLTMDRAHARWWKPGDQQDQYDDDWREKKVQTLQDRLVKTGLATEFGKGASLGPGQDASLL